MDTEYIREYVRVASEGSMAKAAVQLNISQPGLSKHMVALEKCVGASCCSAAAWGSRQRRWVGRFLRRR